MLHVVEREADVMAELDARQLTKACLLADPSFGNGKMFGELLGVQKPRKAIALGGRIGE